MYSQECVFCKIIKKEIPSKIIFENDKTLAFLDIFPINPGHTIVIPKKHYQNLEDIPENELIELYKIVKKLATLIRNKLNIDGYNVLQNNFEAAGQVIQHFHIHIIPRNKTDDKFKIKIPRKQSNEEELNKIQRKIVE
ncbi:MAG TPA: HIT family protein [Candidatus Lokiarchaeia archaeon]